MASVAVQQAPVPMTLEQISGPNAAQTGATPPHHVETNMNYFKGKDDGSALEPIHVHRSETYAGVFETRPVTVHDVTGHEADFTLDNSGFQFCRHETVQKDFVNEEGLKDTYYHEVEQVVKDVTGASRVYAFDHTVRRFSPDDKQARNRQLRSPVQCVHKDQSYEAALGRVTHELPADAAHLLRGRVQIVNLWRPLVPVERDPLALTRADSVAEADLVTIPLVYPGRVGETVAVRWRPSHAWFYKYRMTPADIILLKCFDSKKDGRARRSPHSAFVDPATPPEVPIRQSIEVRCLVFHEDDTLE